MNTLAAQLYTLRDYIKTPPEIAQTLKKVHEIGYEAIQVSGMGPIEPTELKKIADDNGLEIVCTHISFERFLNDIPGIIKDHKAMGCTTAGVGAMPGDMRSCEGYKNFAEQYTKAARLLKEEGINTTYHNHKFEFERFDGKTGLDIIKDNSDTFTFMIDTYWVQAGGADPAQTIIDFGDRVDIVHFKDMDIVNDAQTMSEVLEGNLNWNAIFEACKQCNVRWHIVEQDVCRRNPFDSLKISYDNLKKKGF